MAETDDYRGNLAACWRMAEKASNEVEKRAWLEMAESWKLLIISGYEGLPSTISKLRPMRSIGADVAGRWIRAQFRSIARAGWFPRLAGRGYLERSSIE